MPQVDVMRKWWNRVKEWSSEDDGWNVAMVIKMASPVIIVVAILLLTGCDRYFVEPYIEQLENPTLTDIHLQSNRHFSGEEESCLPNAQHKAEYMRKHGFNPTLMAIQKHDTVDTHAFVVVKGIVYDNGFMSEVPFPVADLAHYGRIVPWQASWGSQ